MHPTDTSPEVQKRMDEHYRQMSPAEKGGVLQRAWQTARCLQLAGLRRRFPNEDEESLELRLARIWIGDELFEKVQAWKATLKDE